MTFPHGHGSLNANNYGKLDIDGSAAPCRDHTAELRKSISETCLSNCRFEGPHNLNSKSFVSLPLGAGFNKADQPYIAMRELSAPTSGRRYDQALKACNLKYSSSRALKNRNMKLLQFSSSPR